MISVFKDIYKYAQNLDNDIIKIIRKGLFFSFVVCILSALFLCTYLFFNKSSIIFLEGFTLFSLALSVAVEFIICGFVFDIILKGKG